MERLEWNLDELFESSEAFYAEIDKTKLLLEDIKKYEKIEMNASVLEEMLNEKWKIKEMSNNILVYGSLRYYKNINDEESIKLKKIVYYDIKYIERKDRKKVQMGEI